MPSCPQAEITKECRQSGWKFSEVAGTGKSTGNAPLSNPRESLNSALLQPDGSVDKELTCQCRRRRRHGFDHWLGKIPWRRAWQPTSIFFRGESQGQRSLVGCSSSSGHKELDTTEHICTHNLVGPGHPLFFISGNPWFLSKHLELYLQV